MDITLERILSLIPSEKDGRFKKYAAADFASKIGVAQNLPSEQERRRRSCLPLLRLKLNGFRAFGPGIGRYTPGGEKRFWRGLTRSGGQI